MARPRGDDLASVLQARVEELKRVYRARDDKQDRWQAAYEMRRPPAEPGFMPVPSNLVQTTVDRLVGMLSGPLRHHVPVFGDDKRESELAARKEVFLRGIYRQYDSIQNRRGRPKLQRSLAQHMVLRGWYACRPLLLEGAEQPFALRVYDPRTVYPAFSDKGLQFFACEQRDRWEWIWHTYGEELSKAGKAWEDHGPGDLLTILDTWEQDAGGVWNVTLVDSEIVKKQKEDFDRIPIVCGPVGGLDIRTGSKALVNHYTAPHDPSDPFAEPWDDSNFEALIGMSIAEKIKPIQDLQSMLYTLLMANVEKHIDPPLMLWTPDGKPVLIDRAPGAINFMRQNPQATGKIDVLRHQGPPPEFLPLINALGEMADKGAVPRALWGSVGQNLTGFAISQLQTAGLHIALPFKEALEFCYEQMDSLLLEQYAKFTTPLSGIWTYDTKTQRTLKGDLAPRDILADPFEGEAKLESELDEFGEYGEYGDEPRPRHSYELTAEDAKGDHRCDTIVTLKLSTPIDEMQRAQIAATLTRPDNPIVSKYHVLENVLEIEDSSTEIERVKKQRFDMDPELAMVDQIEALMKEATNGSMTAFLKAGVLMRRLQIEANGAQVALTQSELALMQGQMAKVAQTLGLPPEAAMGGPPLPPGPPGMPPEGGPPAPPGPPGAPPPGGSPPEVPGMNGMAVPPVAVGGVDLGGIPYEDRGSPLAAQMEDNMIGAGVLPTNSPYG